MYLTPEQEALLETEFPAEIEKQAAEQADTLNSLFDMGFYKMAAAAADEMDEEEEEENEGDKKKMRPEHRKEATARGEFLARYYVEGLMKEGSERRDDELYYLYPAITEALVKMGADKEDAEGFVDKLKKHYETAKGKASDYGHGIKRDIMEAYTGKGHLTPREAELGLAKGKKMKIPNLDWKKRLAAGGKGVGKAVGPVAALAALGYGGYKALGKKEQNA